MRQIDVRSSFIALEGNIGAGKTSLARKLTLDLNGKILLESFEENPYLKKFYESKEDYAFETEMWFLNSRADALADFVSSNKNSILISDYVFEKTLWFAKENLDAAKFELFRKYYLEKELRISRPDVLVILHLPVSELVKNIKNRGRFYEENISEKYLENFNAIYLEIGKQSEIKNKINIFLREANEENYSRAFQEIRQSIHIPSQTVNIHF